MVYVLFVLGFVFLVFGSDWLVEGASSLAKRFNISDLVIGLTIVSFGTSAPELAVNVIASWEGQSTLALSNIMGSNVANILLVLGVAAFIRPLHIKSNTIWKEIPLSLLAAVLMTVLLNDFFVDNVQTDQLGRGDGFVLASFFIVFMYYTFGLAQAGDLEFEELGESIEHIPVWKAVGLTVFGLVMLPLGGNWIVDGAVLIAKDIGMSEAVIGVVIVGVGTSLPELAASAMAAYKGKTDIAVGNAVGSNIFNIFWVLGFSAIIRPLAFDPVMNIDLMMVISASALLWLFAMVGKKSGGVNRFAGIVFLVSYFAYITYLLVRN